MNRVRYFVSSLAILALASVAVSSACNSAVVAPTSPATGSTEIKPGGTAAYQLNLSHIECVEGGKVEVHFVLLHVPNPKVPSQLSWYNNGVLQPLVTTSGKTGNVWHFSVLTNPGAFNVTAASVIVDGVVVSVHNAGAYTGLYNCTPNVCAALVTPQGWGNNQLTCLASPLGSPSAECGLFGLAPDGGDAGSGAQTQTTSKAAILAIVKDGSVGCGPGNQSYTMVSPVAAGQTVFQPGYPNGGGISHVTFCKCPVPANPLRQ